MAVQTTRTLPAQFVEDLGKDLAKQVTAQSGVPIVSTGIAGISQQPGEAAADFQARQQAAREFTTRQQSLAGLAPQVAQQDALQNTSSNISNSRCRIFCTFFTTSSGCRNSSRNSIRWSRCRSTGFSTRRARFYVTIPISSY